MIRKIFVILLFSVIMLNATIDQTYVQHITRDGSSTITKTDDISLFSSMLGGSEALINIDNACKTDEDLACKFDIQEKIIELTSDFEPGSQYKFEVNYGIPFIEYKLTIKKIPTERFSSQLDNILMKANVIESPGKSVKDIELEAGDAEIIDYMRLLGMTMSYQITMPGEIYSTSSGVVVSDTDKNSATFDILDRIERAEYVTIKSRELNLGYLTIIAMAIVLFGLAWSFINAKNKGNKKRRK